MQNSDHLMKSLDELIAEDKNSKKFNKYGGAGLNYSFNKRNNQN